VSDPQVRAIPTMTLAYLRRKHELRPDPIEMPNLPPAAKGKRSTIILTTLDGTPWTSNGSGASPQANDKNCPRSRSPIRRVPGIARRSEPPWENFLRPFRRADGQQWAISHEPPIKRSIMSPLLFACARSKNLFLIESKAWVFVLNLYT
jgi:hypothetical protein